MNSSVESPLKMKKEKSKFPKIQNEKKRDDSESSLYTESIFEGNLQFS